MQINKAVITAAGFGSRFLPITKSFPKEMLPIIDKPIIHHLVEECAAAGVKEVIIVVGPAEIDKFEDYFYGRATHVRTLMIRQNKLERWSKVEGIFNLPQITIVPQDERLPYGNGSPILSVRDLLINEEAFIVMFGDDMVLTNEIPAAKQMVDAYLAEPADAMLGSQEVSSEEIVKLGMIAIKPGTERDVAEIVEKPEPEAVTSHLAQYGRFILTPKIYDYLVSDDTGKDGEIWLTDAIAKLAKDGRVLCQQLDGQWMTTGDPLVYMKAHIQFALKDPKIGLQIKEYIKGLQL